MKKTILIGGGGHSLSLLEMVGDNNQFLGYSDVLPRKDMPIPYLGSDDDVLKKYSPDDFNVCLGFVYMEKVNLEKRKHVIQKFENFEFASYTAYSAIISPNSVIGSGCIIFHKSIINRSSIGENSVVNTGVIVEHDCKLGKNVFLGSGAIICGGASIGNNVFIGAGTIIRDGITIKDNVIIGMGSLITSNIIHEGIYYGHPSKKIG